MEKVGSKETEGERSGECCGLLVVAGAQMAQQMRWEGASGDVRVYDDG